MLFKGQQIGKYKILDAIGSGGFGSVYLAKDTWIDKPVAIKIPHKQGEDVEKLLKEPRLLAAMDHPNIVTVITAEKSSNLFYIVMEYVDGMSLEQYLRKHQILKLPRALEQFLEICAALEYAHGRKIIHRDIRPANVLMSKDGRLKVTDFGTSRFLLDHKFASTRVGSPPYMAPEHFSGRATLQSDIYSMGILMYECLTGKLPFFDPSPQKMAQLAREGNARSAHHINPEIPLECSQIIHRAMHPALSSRYATVTELVSDLRRALRQFGTADSQELAHLVEAETGGAVSSIKTGTPANRPGNGMPDLFCWNCRRPVSKRARVCPHCNEPMR